MSNKDKIKNLLIKSLTIDSIEIIDESFKHKGHTEAKESTGGHYQIKIVAKEFTNLNLVQRHKCVNEILKAQYGQTIHALSIKALSPEELIKRKTF